MSDDKPRATSSVLTKFSQNQIQEMKEAFTMIDQDRDGLISVNDLKEMYSNLGTVPSDSVLEKMVKEIPSGSVNFTAFLSMFSDKLSGTDPEDTLRNAFAMFDAESTGIIPEEYLRDLLQNMGDNFNADEIRQTMKEAIQGDGKCHYNEFVGKLKGKEQDE